MLSQATSLRNLELQMDQLANELKSRSQGALSMHMENSRRDGKEQRTVVTTHSGLSYEESVLTHRGIDASTSISTSEVIKV